MEEDTAEYSTQDIQNVHHRNFLERGIPNNVTPNFLKFPVPTNGCFKNESVLALQQEILKEEISKS